MKRALIISYYWPPSGGAGVQRWLKFVKYIRLSGWEPIVYTPENPEYPERDTSLLKDVPQGMTLLRQPIWEPYDLYKKLLGQKKEEKINAAFLSEKKKNRHLENLSVWIRGNFFIPDARKFWIKPSVKYLQRYLTDHPVEMIISTGPPHSMHLIAMTLASRFKIPWLADFRDPWTKIDFYKDLRLSARADALHRKLEKQVLKQADGVTVISNSMADDFNKIVPRHYDVITNGFDQDDMTGEPVVEPDKKFSIAHIGTLVSSRNPLTLWEALKSMVGEDPQFASDLEIKLVGKVDFQVTASIGEHGLTEFVRRIDYMPHNEVVQCQRQSQVLLLIINNTPNAKMILTGKFFEYLAAKRPILCLGPVAGDAAKILSETNAGLLAGFDDLQSMKQHIQQFYRDFKNGTLRSASTEIDRYSRSALTRELCVILDRIQASGSS